MIGDSVLDRLEKSFSDGGEYSIHDYVQVEKVVGDLSLTN